MLVLSAELTRRANGSLRISKSVLFWYLRISSSARVPGLYLFFSAAPRHTELGRCQMRSYYYWRLVVCACPVAVSSTIACRRRTVSKHMQLLAAGVSCLRVR
jgi:hypothetical protein